MMRIRCIDTGGYRLSLKKDKVYEARESQLGWFALVDETGEEYVFPPYLFEEAKERPAFSYAASKERIAALAEV